MPKLTHPGSKRAIEVPEDQVPMYASQGWQQQSVSPKRKKPATNKGDDSQ